MDLTILNIDNYSDHELFNLFDIKIENIHKIYLSVNKQTKIL